MSPEALALAAGVGALSWALTGAVLRYAREHAVLDVPNHRSSHTTPTPRGGGLAIVVAAIAGIGVAAALGWVSARHTAALVGGGTLVAGVGWLDDRRGVAAGPRALVHLAAALWVVAAAGGVPVLRLAGQLLPLGFAGSALAVLWVAWATNLYNFMDGIDGIAGIEGVCVGVFGAGMLAAAGRPGLAAVSLVAAAACAGFLPWNWSPARIFMGDVGSGFLGFLFGALSVLSERLTAAPLLAWVALLGVFVFDATATLLRRMVRGEAFLTAHRSHAYQRAVQAGWAHDEVSAAVVTLTVPLAALAWAAASSPRYAPAALLTVLALLTATYLYVERRRPMPPSRRPAVPVDG